jgi:hypothetical protein
MPAHFDSGFSRRQVLAASGTGLLAATAGKPGSEAVSGAARAARATGRDGTPEQIHLTWGDDPARSVVVSWASPGQAVRPRVRIGQRLFPAEERRYTDGLNGETTWTYHARVPALRPGATYGYAVTADNDANAADPFSATFTTAPEGRAAFRFTSFGDLATPANQWAGSYGQAAYAVGAVEQFQPLFHLLNGDLCYAGLNPAFQPQVWRDFGNSNQPSAAYRPWMPVPGNHEIEFGNGPEGFTSYLTRYTLPANGSATFEGRWYSFRVGSVLFVSLSADDVAYQDAGAFVAGPSALLPAAVTGNPPIPAGTSFYVRGYSGGAQTRWLEDTLAAARRDSSIDWIVAQLHQSACSSSRTGNGSDLGIREEWLPLFDRYEVDLVLSGHDHDYERSFPVRGNDTGAGSDAATAAPVFTRRPHPVTTVDSGVFDTSLGTVHLVLGCGGTDASRDTSDAAGAIPSPRMPQARVFTRPNRPVLSASPGVYDRPRADAVEAATWSARRDTATPYGIAVFDVHPGTVAGGQTSISVSHYHAVTNSGAPTGDYTVFETFTLVRPRSDGRRWHAKQSPSAVGIFTALSRTAGGDSAALRSTPSGWSPYLPTGKGRTWHT